MFKLLRQYQKYIVVIGVTVLMVAFLLGDTLMRFVGPTPENTVMGTANGREITLRDQQIAQSEIQLLQRINPNFALVIGRGMDQDHTHRWVMLGLLADELGIESSQTEVMSVFGALGLNEDAITNLAKEQNVKRAALPAAVGSWLRRERVIALLRGRAHQDVEIEPSPGLRRFITGVQAFQRQFAAENAMRSGDQVQAEQFMREATVYQAIATGTQRVSRPLMEHMLSDMQAEVSASYVLLRPDHLGIHPEPSDSMIQELFDQYKDVPNGDSEPYGFGYRFLDRVRIESLTIPIDAVLSTIRVEESEALAFYEENQDAFRPMNEQGQPDLGAETLAYREVRGQIRDYLQQQMAREKVEEIARAASSLLEAELRGVPQVEGYYAFPDDFRFSSLRHIAEQIEAEYGVRPAVRAAPAAFTDVRDLVYDPVLGSAMLVSNNRRISITEYVSSVRELEPDRENPLLTRFLQVGVPSSLMDTPTGSMMFFRIVDAEVSRTPESLDEVREQVTADARELAGYQALLEVKQAWADRAQQQPLSEIANEIGSTEIDTGLFTRRTRDRSGRTVVPGIQGIGRDADWVEAVFEKARELREAGDIETFQPGERTLVQPVPGVLGLSLVRVDEYQPMSRGSFELMLQEPAIGAMVSESLMTGDEPSALDVASLEQAVNYEHEMDADADEDKAAQESEDTTDSPASS